MMTPELTSSIEWVMDAMLADQAPTQERQEHKQSFCLLDSRNVQWLFQGVSLGLNMLISRSKNRFMRCLKAGIITDLGLSVAQYSMFGSIMTFRGMIGALISGKVADLVLKRGDVVWSNFLHCRLACNSFSRGHDMVECWKTIHMNCCWFIQLLGK
ncbi:unnamed protein product [Thlaspi arvense]|uniref:Uncharacterized protein n=1 Tax=Thlaspi arvense TaxID=13288 RepID=A0AAU9SP20_THLAR|nr:unnamed protein product [Thlaspi arvense]